MSTSLPLLKKSYKGRFPFKIGTTSFVYPDRYAPNVGLLGPFLDEIEILFFESPAPTDLQLEFEMRELKKLAAMHHISYNVHLPLDIAVGHFAAIERQKAVDVVQHVFTLTHELQPTTFTLHLPYTGLSHADRDVRAWQVSIAKGLEQLLASGISFEILSIETLDYPFEWVESLIDDFDLSVCIDLGHLLVNEFNVGAVFEAHAHRTTIIHLHGVADGRDHLPLDRMPSRQWAALIPFLIDFKGTVSLEVFSFDALQRSLDFLEGYWQAL
jgi:sugar phosphate isomerase/epimerase